MSSTSFGRVLNMSLLIFFRLVNACTRFVLMMSCCSALEEVLRHLKQNEQKMDVISSQVESLVVGTIWGDSASSRSRQNQVKIQRNANCLEIVSRQTKRTICPQLTLYPTRNVQPFFHFASIAVMCGAPVTAYSWPNL